MPPTTYYTLFVFGHLLFSALGVRALGLALGVSRAGALVAAVLWMLSGPLLSLVNVWHHFAGAAWIPWVLLAADRAVTRGRRGDTVRWGVAMAAQVLAGSADMLTMTTPLALAHAALRGRAWGPRLPWPGSRGSRGRRASWPWPYRRPCGCPRWRWRRGHSGGTCPTRPAPTGASIP